MGDGRGLMLVAFVFLLASLFGCIALVDGISSSTPDIPPGAVAIVEDAPPGMGTITQAELDQEMLQQASFTGAARVPEPGDKEYEQRMEESLSALITAVWLMGQAEELGIAVTHAQIAESLRESEEGRSLKSANYTRKTIDERVRLSLATNRIQEKLGEQASDPTEEEIRLYYEEDPPENQIFAEARDEVLALLEAQKEQEIFDEVDVSFPREWRLRTHCADRFVVAECAEFPGFARLPWMPEACYEEDPEEPADDCPAPVTARSAVMPGSVRPWRPEGDRRVQRPVPPGGGEAEAVE